jgi:hypothetical protein
LNQLSGFFSIQEDLTKTSLLYGLKDEPGTAGSLALPRVCLLLCRAWHLCGPTSQSQVFLSVPLPAWHPQQPCQPQRH